MKKSTKAVNKIVNSLVKKTLVNSANSTTCIYVHQPKAPDTLKSFSKLSNDK